MTQIFERDPFGVRPLYYARHGGTVHVSNDLASLLSLVPHDLDDDSIADFLLHGFPVDPARTMFRHIARVPPAHRLIVEDDRVRVERYWSFPIRDTPIRIGEREARETFRELLVAAVNERATGPVVVSMSGGLDSTSVAAALVHAGAEVRALTAVWDELIPDEERAASTLAAKHLGIPIDFQPCDRYVPFERPRGFEPNPEPFSAAFHDFMAIAATRGSVLMGGWGGDPLLATSRSYLFDLLRRGRWLRLASEAGRFAVTRKAWPPLLLRTHLGLHKNRDTPPAWLLPPLRERWHEPMPVTDARVHPYRPEAFRGIHSTAWQAVFESYSQHPIEFAAPLFDTRLLEFALSLPPMPHFAGKDLLRQAMRGWLPDAVRLRPKTPLPGDPLRVSWPRMSRQWIGTVDACDALDPFVDRRILREDLRSGRQSHVRHQAHAIALAQWLGA
jgi:asparagine synthase (glutamine-hydrolysing)